MMSYAGLEIVTLLALIEYSVLGAMVGRARLKYKVEAPATTGNAQFERYFRVHQNTLEALIVFLPAVWIFSLGVNYQIGVALGVLFLLGRILYANGYLNAPEKRAPGAIVTFAINTILVVGGLGALLVRAI
ncbi:MAG: MAPEG family protein [Candidatus Binatus sp.]|uniref:MAPEG family protein n=1 Tax=Candidatus Binatus sp. TaxID=2811406 RepID=UPI00271FA9CA|nr:MAPEG family protein [Candidatus Binatus sp.]MDO8430878.1 MAPEG family protein [Candidatus Binatus sp.]